MDQKGVLTVVRELRLCGLPINRKLVGVLGVAKKKSGLPGENQFSVGKRP